MPVFILVPVVTGNLDACVVKHSYRPEKGVRQLWQEGIGVGGREDAVDDNIAGHGVRVVEAIGPLCCHGGHVACRDHVANLDGTRGLQLAVDVQVVTGRQPDRLFGRGGNFDKVGLSHMYTVYVYTHGACGGH